MTAREVQGSLYIEKGTCTPLIFEFTLSIQTVYMLTLYLIIKQVNNERDIPSTNLHLSPFSTVSHDYTSCYGLILNCMTLCSAATC
jgi:hypothetical protein